MHTLYVGIHSVPHQTRLLVLSSSGQPLLKARLCRLPASSLALPQLLKALALWQKAEVRAVLFADDAAPLSAPQSLPAVMTGDDVLPITLVRRLPLLRPHRRDDLIGLGHFRDLAEKLWTEALAS
jgi:hypothetical protein